MLSQLWMNTYLELVIIHYLRDDYSIVQNTGIQPVLILTFLTKTIVAHNPLLQGFMFEIKLNQWGIQTYVYKKKTL